MKYQNPIIEGFYPDPSVCRVEEEYYLITSSFEYFPGIPIFHSKDLVNWEQIGHCLTNDKQLPIQNALNSYGIYAPTIRFHNGRFYVIATNVTNYYNFFVWSENPSGPWSDPVKLEEWDGIDPSLFFDDDGKVYIMGNSYKKKAETLGCYMAELDINTGKLKTERRLVCTGSGGKAPEAPHLYKKDGKYYLILAEGGTEYGHMVTVFRSDNPYGPFESYENNPVLTHRSRKHTFQGIGHMDLVEDHQGNWWGVCLGMRPKGSHAYFHHLGRETFLVPVVWTQDGWIEVGTDKMVAETYENPLMTEKQKRPGDFEDDFSTESRPKEWVYLRNPERGNYALDKSGKGFWLIGNKESLSSGGACTFIGKRQCHFECDTTTEFYVDFKNENDEAGLTAYMSDHYYYAICVKRKNNENYIVLRKKIADFDIEETTVLLEDDHVVLGIEADEKMYKFYFKDSKNKKWFIGKAECRFLASEISATFTGTILGIYITANGNEETPKICVNNFKYGTL